MFAFRNLSLFFFSEMGKAWQKIVLVTAQTLRAYKYLHDFIFLYLVRVIKIQTADSTDGKVVTDH